MARFNPCRGRMLCRPWAGRCHSCGRSLDEIARTKLLVEEIANFIQAMDYENADEFMGYLSHKIAKKLNH